MNQYLIEIYSMEEIMAKNKLYLLISIITLVCFFGTAAICSLCSADTAGETENAEEEEEVAAEAAVEEEEGETLESEEEDGPADEEESAGEEEDEEEEGMEDIEKEAPTITLEVYDGPTYSSGDNVCYYRVKATVTGDPTPSVVFSRDDSGGAWGSKKTQVNLGDPSETYTLTATATNLEGTATDSIILSWGCNRSPGIAEIILMGNHYTGIEYTVSGVASDPDGDSLTYQWSTTGGSILDNTSNPIKWTTPANAGDYNLTVTVDDGKGGTAIETVTVEVLPSLGPPIANMDVPIAPSEGGYISEDMTFLVSDLAFDVGDTSGNKVRKAYISFNILGLAGLTVTDATLTFNFHQQFGDPSSFVPLWISSVNWGSGVIVPGDYNLTGDPIQSFTNHSFTCNSPELKLYLQNAIDSSRARFQIMIFFTGMATDNNNDHDLWRYDRHHINLNMSYTH